VTKAITSSLRKSAKSKQTKIWVNPKKLRVLL